MSDDRQEEFSNGKNGAAKITACPSSNWIVRSNISHYIIKGGPYAIAFAKLAATGFKLRWQSRPEGQGRKKKRASKTKFTCPECGQNAWAKPDAGLGCYACYEDSDELILMLAEPPDEDAEAA